MVHGFFIGPIHSRWGTFFAAYLEYLGFYGLRPKKFFHLLRTFKVPNQLGQGGFYSSPSHLKPIEVSTAVNFINKTLLRNDPDASKAQQSMSFSFPNKNLPASQRIESRLAIFCQINLFWYPNLWVPALDSNNQLPEPPFLGEVISIWKNSRKSIFPKPPVTPKVILCPFPALNLTRGPSLDVPNQCLFLELPFGCEAFHPRNKLKSSGYKHAI